MIMIYAENVALKQKPEPMLFCRYWMKKKNEKWVMILVSQTFWEEMRWW